MSRESDLVAAFLRWEARERYDHEPEIAEAMERAAQCIEAGDHLVLDDLVVGWGGNIPPEFRR